MQRRSPAGITLVEVMVACVVVLTLVLVMTTFLSRVPERTPWTRVCSNMGQIHQAIYAMTLDNATPEGRISYTCRDRHPMTMAEVKDALVQGGYVTGDELKRYLGFYGRGMLGLKRDMGEAFDLFALDEQDGGNTLFAVTKNWHGFPSGTLSGEPYGSSGFVVFRMDGTGSVLLPRFATDQKAIGSAGRYNYWRLK